MEGCGVYILQCSNGRYYTGSTNDIGRRYKEHCSGSVNATKNLRPLKLVFFQNFDTLIRARQVEYLLKKKKSSIIIQRIIKEGRIHFFQSEQ